MISWALKLDYDLLHQLETQQLVTDDTGWQVHSRKSLDFEKVPPGTAFARRC